MYLGHFSWRNSQQGSWFVQALGNELTKSLSSTDAVDFAQVLTKVSHRVAYEFQSNATQARLSAKKQVPSVYSTLTKEIHFPNPASDWHTLQAHEGDPGRTNVAKLLARYTLHETLVVLPQD